MKSITQLAATFAFQSYFDSGLLPRAILAQTNGNPIVDSTRQYAQIPGVGVALHPSSQSPVAIKFKGGGADSAVVHLTPGQKILPGDFTSFEWGLPFGWLGGGPVILYVLGDKNTDVGFPSVNSPIIFHRQRVVIEPGDLGPIVPPNTPNWPLAFPWGNANRQVGGSRTPQQAAPLFQLVPDIVMLQFLGLFAVPVDLVIEFVNVDAFDRQSPPDQAAGYSNGLHLYPITVPAVPAPVGPLAAVFWLPAEIAKLAGDSAEFHVLDPTSTAGIVETFVDVVRYGRLM
jgi:hypothetical protein